MTDDVYKLIELLNDRYTDLANSFRVLNDNHDRLELGLSDLKLEFVKFRTQINTAAGIVKYLVPSSLILSAVVFVVKLAELLRWI